ncbi:hypothetical protein [Streptomyces sp. V3I7]|uniref:hypothetical protein n=1 Tax=Streptomyces sp. V3I7 TaxID=3042278 RepID=UPI0027899D35|nr:hypothetical protein [Streptomyces sp. V3I7]MDQ0990992.1 hypothetical protein [Streptomyces sp. V3I7]
MRGLPAGRLASTALCATVLVGAAVPAAVAADSARERTHAASRAPVPGADALLAQVATLGALGTVLQPVTDLLDQALKNGQLAPAAAQKFVDAVKTAIEKITAAPPAAPETSAITPPSMSAVEAAPATGAGSLPGQGDAKAPAAGDLQGDVLADLQKSVESLLQAVTSGDTGLVLPTATGVVTGLVDLVAATLLGGGLPEPALADLSASSG